MDVILGLVILGVIGMFWFIAGLTNDRRRRDKREFDEFIGVIDVRRNAKDKLRDDDYTKRVRDKYND